MSTITLKGVPEDVHAALKVQAKAHGRSLNREAIAILSERLHASRIDAEVVAGTARAVRESMRVYLTETELEALKRAGRR